MWLPCRSLCEDVRVNKALASGKVVLCFTSSVSRSAAARAALSVSQAGGLGVIVAKNRIGTLASCTDDFPCIEVDYEVGTQMLFYIRTSNSPLVKFSPSRTVVGKPVTARVAYFSARGPNSIEPAVLKVHSLLQKSNTFSISLHFPFFNLLDLFDLCSRM